MAVASFHTDTELNFSAVKNITMHSSYTLSNNQSQNVNVENYFESPTSKICRESSVNIAAFTNKCGYRVKENMTVKVQVGWTHDNPNDWYAAYDLVNIWNDRTGKHIVISGPNDEGVKKYASGQLECLSGDVIYEQWQKGPYQYKSTQYECIFYG